MLQSPVIWIFINTDDITAKTPAVTIQTILNTFHFFPSMYNPKITQAPTSDNNDNIKCVVFRPALYVGQIGVDNTHLSVNTNIEITKLLQMNPKTIFFSSLPPYKLIRAV